MPDKKPTYSFGDVQAYVGDTRIEFTPGGLGISNEPRTVELHFSNSEDIRKILRGGYGELSVGHSGAKPNYVSLDDHAADPYCNLSLTENTSKEQEIFDAFCAECGGITATDVTGAHWHVSETVCVLRGWLRVQRVKFKERVA